MKLTRDFYNQETLIVAKELLGKTLVHYVGGNKISGRIIEVEAYKGLKDKAAHSYGGKITKRVETMYGPSGYAYVYLIYGMYNCMNVVTREEGIPEAILIRGIEPLEGLDCMSLNRFNKNFTSLTKSESIRLTNGPGKLSIAFSINRSNNGQDLCGENLYIEDSNYKPKNIIASKRIGIDYAKEAKDYLWRFYIEGNPFVSK
ncbi:DNA-3-methyladenine glycosylase [Sporosalibacterium faouarense]|uniref:DNA-3-methyladenine glycosylase n=1 Tax=Sporosalibacterium faouarense TaxID=516123 RepID=UPI00141CC4D5|nr:DNA-3-methyladenine glycosylase [Sporosalibacterium faouarense]MTI46928.1 DNA-3-methyladenine glycosylase [Bacillota bacterium]